MTDPIDVLAAFSKKEVGVDAAMRALVQHDGWLVPIHAVADMQGGGGQHVAVDYPVVMYAQNFSMPTDKLLVFTDRARADAAAAKFGHEVMGLYVEKVPGTVLFKLLETAKLAAVQELRVNPASPQEQQWFIGRGGFVVSGAWADAVALERKLADVDESLFGALNRYEGWWVPIAKSDRTLVQLNLDHGPSALAFTAPDQYQKFLHQMGDRASQIEPLAGVASSKLIPLILSTQLQGLLVNASIPLKREALEIIVAS